MNIRCDSCLVDFSAMTIEEFRAARCRACGNNACPDCRPCVFCARSAALNADGCFDTALPLSWFRPALKKLRAWAGDDKPLAWHVVWFYPSKPGNILGGPRARTRWGEKALGIIGER